MSAMTVHRPLERVNTLVRVTSEESPGARLKGYIRAHWTRKMGGDVALAKAAGIRRQTLQEWYAGSSVPRLTELEEVARTIGVRRVDLVASYDGVTAPETTKEPPPEWATEMERRLTDLLMTNRTVFVETMATYFARLGVETALDDPPPNEPDPETPGAATKPVEPQ